MKLPLAALLLVFTTVRSVTAFAQQTPTIFPFEPAELLKVLPAAPADWKVLQSQAGTTLGDWPETRATRRFEAPLPAPADGAAEAAPSVVPGRIEIVVVDTAGFTPSLVAFAAFAPCRNGNVEKKLIGSLPAIVTTNDSGKVFSEILVSTRYLVQITLVNLPRQRVEDWLRNFHFDALPAANRLPTRQSNGFRLTHVDELQPRKNRSFVVSTTNAKRVDAYLKALPEPADGPTGL